MLKQSWYESGETEIPVPIDDHIVIGSVEAFLTHACGGYTRLGMIGGWHTSAGPVREHGFLYKVAGMTDEQREELASYLLTEGQQTDIYMRLPDGRCCWYNLVNPSSET